MPIWAFVVKKYFYLYNKSIYLKMDFKNSIDYRTSKFKDFDILGKKPYDYEKYGILTKCLPKILFKGNSILVTFLQLIDMRLIMMFKYIDKVKQFKWITRYV